MCQEKILKNAEQKRQLAELRCGPGSTLLLIQNMYLQLNNSKCGTMSVLSRSKFIRLRVTATASRVTKYSGSVELLRPRNVVDG